MANNSVMRRERSVPEEMERFFPAASDSDISGMSREAKAPRKQEGKNSMGITIPWSIPY